MILTSSKNHHHAQETRMRTKHNCFPRKKMNIVIISICMLNSHSATNICSSSCLNPHRPRKFHPPFSPHHLCVSAKFPLIIPAISSIHESSLGTYLKLSFSISQSYLVCTNSRMLRFVLAVNEVLAKRTEEGMEAVVESDEDVFDS